MITNKFKTAVRRVSVSMAFWLVAALAQALVPTQAHAQAPSLLWSTNIGARVFAVDAQTNVYVDAGGKVIKLNGAGALLQTNFLSVYPGMAQRDGAGNYYYAGVYPGKSNGIGYEYTNPPCFLAKYTGLGVLVWTVDLGPWNGGPVVFLRRIGIADFQIDANGNLYVYYPAVSESVTSK